MYLENTKIIEIDNNLSQKEKERNLSNLYDVINEIGKSLYEKGVDISKYFFTESQYKDIKKENYPTK